MPAPKPYSTSSRSASFLQSSIDYSLLSPADSILHVVQPPRDAWLHISEKTDMDQVLKARKLGSASARRKRIQAREKEEVHAQEQYVEHKRRIMLYDHRAEENESPSESESTDGSVPSQRDREESVTTPSESSVTTPNDTPSSIFEKTEAVTIEVNALPEKPQLHLVLPDTPVDGSEPSTINQPSPTPKLQASLVALSDFTYDRYSMILDAPAQVVSPSESVSTPELEFDDYSPSPVEIATPVSIRLPKTRPSVISITNRSSKKRRTTSVQSPLSQETRPQSLAGPPPPPPRSERRLSQSSTRSGFLAFEAKLMEMPDLPPNASSMIANASRESVSLTPNGEGQKAVNRKSSQPFLSAIKTSHARMSSIKSLIRSPTHNPTPSISSTRPESRSSRPPTSAADIMNDAFQAFETVPANLYELPPALRSRPHTSHRPSRPSTSSTASRQPSVTALPVLPTPRPISSASQTVDQAPEPESGLMRRKKSFSALRKRSESIGQAIKFVANKSKGTAGHTPKLSQQMPSQQQHNVPLPPPPPLAPILMIPDPKHSVELSNFPTPPLPSPSASLSARSRKSVASYSMFPPSPQIGHDRKSGVGLGLGLKV